MFNSNNNSKSSTKAGAGTPGNNLPSVNMISEGTHLKGNLQTKNDIRIAGSLEGEADASGKLIITSSGSVTGDVKAVDADIAGNLNGEIFVQNKLVLRQSAVIDGDIHTKSLLVEEGARINGTCHMGDDIATGPANAGQAAMNKPLNEPHEGAKA